MKVLIVVEPGIDGVFRHVEGLIHHLLSENQKVDLAYSSLRGSEHLERLVALVGEQGGETLNLNVGNAPGPSDLSAFLRLRELAIRSRPDVIHSHSSKAGVIGRSLALTGIRSRFFYSPHAYYGMGSRPGVAVHFYNLLEMVFGRIGTTINISNDEARFASRKLKIGSRKIRIIHNPVDTSVFKPATPDEKRRQRSMLGLPEHAIVFGTLGRLSFQKDPQTLYRAITPILRRRPEIVLCHVGQGDLDREVDGLIRELRIESQVVRHPYLNEPAGFYKALDVFVLTSRYEAGWPIVVLEALATDLPLIASDAPGTSDIGAAGLSHCWTAKAGEPGKFGEAMDSLLADLPLNRPRNHRATAVARFSPAQRYGAILEAYRQM